VVWVSRVVAVAALGAVAWACLTAWPVVVHGHPAYAVMLGLTVVVAVISLARSARRDRPSRPVRRIVLAVLGLAWITGVVWLRPFPAVEPALAAMSSDSAVTVTEHLTDITMTPTGPRSDVAVFFQPGARVDPRAYAAVLRPLAASGHLVVIVKQPLGIGFLALPSFGSIRDAHPEVARWAIGGHSLGGTVAAINAGDVLDSGHLAGLFFYASYPSNDISGWSTTPLLSVSASLDGLATPAKIDAAKPDLPPSTKYVVVEGAVHASFGDYGPQPGDGTPTIPADDARSQIQAATSAWLDTLTPAPA